jgi:hypothetical protein
MAIFCLINIRLSSVGSFGRVNSLKEVMKLKQVTLVTALGIGLSLVISVAIFPWEYVARNPKMIVSLFNTILWHSALLFFFINLYRKG